MKDELVEVEQQVLATCLDSIQMTSVKALDPDGATTPASRSDAYLPPAECPLDPARSPQDRVALRHTFNE